MLKLARVSRHDVVYDLGCGYGQNLIVAAKKFAVPKCIGVEQVRSRYETAKHHVAKRRLTRRIRIVYGDMDDLLKGRFKGIKPSEATLVLYTIQTTTKVVKLLSQSLGHDCRLVYNAGNGVFPEIKPVAVDYPFYMSTVPFESPDSERDWLTSVLMDEQSEKWSMTKLWTRLTAKLALNRRETKSYRRRLGETLSED
jgi:SAM-dependent methyltransferase